MVTGEYAPGGAATYERKRRSFRGLIAFWLVIGGAAAGGAAFLQVMGPLPAGPVRTTDDINAEKKAVMALKTRAKPPPPPIQPGAIPHPNPNQDLLRDVSIPGYSDRMVPKIGANGLTAAKYYAARMGTPPSGPYGRMALIVDGIGAPGQEAASKQAIAMLPPSVDLAISAYAVDAEGLAAAARAAGHECLVSVPMLPNRLDNPLGEGNLQLLTSDTAADVNRKLDIVLSGVQGCVGATGASDGQNGDGFAVANKGLALNAVIDRIKQTGLIYVDPRFDAPALPLSRPDQPANLALHTNIIIDRPSNSDTPLNLDRILDNRGALEANAVATANDPAAAPVIGLISLASMTGAKAVVDLDNMKRWAETLRDRSVFLVPVTAFDSPAATKPDAARP